MPLHFLLLPPPPPPLLLVSLSQPYVNLILLSQQYKEVAYPSARLQPLPRSAAMVDRPGTAQKPVGLRRAMSAIQRPSSSGLVRPTSSSRPRRPYSAYTRKGVEEEGPKYEAPESGREWWRVYLKVRSLLFYSSCSPRAVSLSVHRKPPFLVATTKKVL